MVRRRCPARHQCRQAVPAGRPGRGRTRQGPRSTD